MDQFVVAISIVGSLASLLSLYFCDEFRIKLRAIWTTSARKLSSFHSGCGGTLNRIQAFCRRDSDIGTGLDAFVRVFGAAMLYILLVPSVLVVLPLSLAATIVRMIAPRNITFAHLGYVRTPEEYVTAFAICLILPHILTILALIATIHLCLRISRLVSGERPIVLPAVVPILPSKLRRAWMAT